MGGDNGGWPRWVCNDRGTVFLLGLTIVMVITLLGIALFEMSTIEASLARSDVSDMQAFFCAEAEAARIFNWYSPVSASNPTGDPSGARPAPPPWTGSTSLDLANGHYDLKADVVIDAPTQHVTVTATCTLLNGRARTVQRNGTRGYLNPGYNYAVVGGGFDAATGVQRFFTDLTLGGVGLTALDASNNNYIQGRDTINGDVYVSGNVYVRGDAAVVGASNTDARATVTVYSGRSVTSDSTRFNDSAPGVVAKGVFDPMPVVTSAQKSGVLDYVVAAITGPDGKPSLLKGVCTEGPCEGRTVYNISGIFAQLGADVQGSFERNLSKPAGCVFGVASADPKCQVWQDLLIVGPKQTCNGKCAPGDTGPSDAPSYFFMGLPRSPSTRPQDTSFNTIFDAAVSASAELRQVGLVAGDYGTLGARLDALLGGPNGEQRADRLVDFTVGTDPTTGSSMVRTSPPIFYVDGYWRADAGTKGLAYNGVATIVASKSMMLSDDLLYLGGVSNVHTTALAQSSACAKADGRANCGFADMLALVANDDIWVGDAARPTEEISALLLAGRDVNFLDYTSVGACCTGPGNPVTINGTVMAVRDAALPRDWAYPNSDKAGANQPCNDAASGCLPVGFFATPPTLADGTTYQGWCGDAKGCWMFLTFNGSPQRLAVDGSRASFSDGCVTVTPKPLAPATCPGRSRRVTHFQLTVNYDSRLQQPALIPPGLPTGGKTVYTVLTAPVSWKDCGIDRSCK